MKPNRAHQNPRTPRQLKNALASALAEKLPLPDGAHHFTRLGIAKATFLATGLRTSITDACETSAHVHPDTYFDHLRTLNHHHVEDALAQANTWLLETAQQEGLIPRECTVALDVHVDPDYSRHHTGCKGWRGLPGTTHAMAYLSTESVSAPSRFTFSFTPLRAFTREDEAIQAQVDETLRWTSIRLALLDRAFVRTYVFQTFLERDIRFVMPMPDNTRVKRLEEEAWRHRRFIPNTPYSAYVVPEYTLKESKRKHRSATVQIVFFFEPDPEDTTRDKVFTFVTNPGELTPKDIVEYATRYRERFGIESGYREKNRMRVRTSSNHYPTRLFLQLASIITYNLWTLLRAIRACLTRRIKPPRKDAVLVQRFLRELVIVFSA